MREHDAFWDSGRAGGVEEHRRLVGRWHDGVERTDVEKAVEAFGAVAAETHDRQVGRTVRPPRLVAKDELGAGILQDEMNCLPRKLEVHRHRDKTRAHDPVIGREILGPIGRKNRHPLAALKSALGERAGNASRHFVEVRIAELARDLLAAEIDDRGLRQIAIVAEEIAEIGEVRHQAFGGGGGAV